MLHTPSGEPIVLVVAVHEGRGEELSEHTASSPVVIQVLRGHLRLTLDGDEVDAESGSWIHMTEMASQAHGFEPWVKTPPGVARHRLGGGSTFLSQVDEILVGMKYRSSNTTVFSAKYRGHPGRPDGRPKYRQRVLVDGIDYRLGQLVREACAELGADVIEMEIMPDHVHLLVEIPPQVALWPWGRTGSPRLVKGRSSWVLRREFPHLRRMRSLWTRSWFVSTVGGAPLDVVRRCVEQQRDVA